MRECGGDGQPASRRRFVSLEVIRKFAGDDYEVAHVAPRARELLSRLDARCRHFDLVIEDEANSSTQRTGFRLADPFFIGTMLSGGGPPCHTTVV